MKTLTLEPDEVLPTTPAPLEGEAYGPFPIFWRGKERHFLLRAVQYNRKKCLVFAREVEGETADNWLIYERGSLTPATWTPASLPNQAANIALDFTARDWDLARIFTVPVAERNGRYSVLLLGNGVGAWLEVDQRFRVWATFDFDSSQVFESSRSQLRGHWQHKMANNDSDLGFAAHFAFDGMSARSNLIFASDEAELFQVIEWVLRCEPRLWERGDVWD